MKSLDLTVLISFTENKINKGLFDNSMPNFHYSFYFYINILYQSFSYLYKKMLISHLSPFKLSDSFLRHKMTMKNPSGIYVTRRNILSEQRKKIFDFVPISELRRFELLIW